MNLPKTELTNEIDKILIKHGHYHDKMADDLATLIHQAEIKILNRVTEELHNCQSVEVDKEEISYYYTTNDVDWALERIANQIKSECQALEKEIVK